MAAKFKLSTEDAPATPGTYVMPFGLYRGRTLKQINRSQTGRYYLLQAADRMEAPNVVKAIKDYLASYSEKSVLDQPVSSDSFPSKKGTP